MKHLLSILIFFSFVSLIFVSCSKSPEQYIESCADAYFPKVNDEWKKNNTKNEWFLSCSEDHDWYSYGIAAELTPGYRSYVYNGCDKTFGKDNIFLWSELDENWNKYILLISEQDKFIKKSLKEKLKNYLYEDRFKRCEVERETTPETFKAKWK
tara:strand:+ start:392 stop:853 length:462 start_codon:yes stop_codon:yes gene_type:complete